MFNPPIFPTVSCTEVQYQMRANSYDRGQCPGFLFGERGKERNDNAVYYWPYAA